MGIFSDKCDKCGAKVRKRARFCSKCRAPAPKGWIKCGQCAKWVGAESAFCPYCNNTMYPEEVELISNNRLQRTAGVFLQRLELNNIKTRLDKKLIVEQGMCAVIMKNGVVSKILNSGVHPIVDGFWKELISGKKDISLLLLETSEIIIPLVMNGLRSKENMEVNLYTEVVFRVDEDLIAELVENLLKEKRQLKYGDLSQAVATVAKRTMSNFANKTTIDELIRNPELRLQFHDKLADAMLETCNSFGLIILRIAELEFFGVEYQKLREKAGEIEAKVRHEVIARRERELNDRKQKDIFKTEKDYQRYCVLVEHEQKLSLLEIEHEQILKTQKLQHDQKTHSMTLEHERKIQNTHSEIELNTIKQEAKIVTDKKQLEANLTNNLSKENHEIEITRSWMQVKNEKRADDRTDKAENLHINREHAAQLLKQYKDCTPMQLLAVLPPQQAENILKLRELEIKEKSMDKELEIRTLKEIQQAKEKCAEEKIRMLEGNAHRLEHRTDKDLDAISKISKNNLPPQINIR